MGNIKGGATIYLSGVGAIVENFLVKEISVGGTILFLINSIQIFVFHLPRFVCYLFWLLWSGTMNVVWNS